MPKTLALLLLPFLTVGGSGRHVDPIAAESAEIAAQIEAMKHHPSLVEREKASAHKADPQ